MNTRKMILIFLLILPLSLGLMLVFREFVLTAVVIPLMYIVWLGNLVLRSINQSFYWILLLFVVGLILITSLRTRKEPLSRSAYPGMQQKRIGRVAFWENKLHLFQQGGRSKEYVFHELRNLVLATLAFRDRERLSPGEIQRRLKKGELNVPPEIQEFLLLKSQSIKQESRPYRHRLMNLLSIFGRNRNRSGLNSNDKDMEKVLQFLEDQLEIKHENGNN